MNQRHELALANALRTWGLLATRDAFEMAEARKLALRVISALPSNLGDMEIEKAIIVNLRNHQLRPIAV